MQYKPHTAALITACAILTAMPAAAVQINQWGGSCGGKGEAACSDYSSGVEFLPVDEGEPYALVANAPLTINGDVALKGPGKLMLRQGAHSVAGKFEFEEGIQTFFSDANKIKDLASHILVKIAQGHQKGHQKILKQLTITNNELVKRVYRKKGTNLSSARPQ